MQRSIDVAVQRALASSFRGDPAGDRARAVQDEIDDTCARLYGVGQAAAAVAGRVAAADAVADALAATAEAPGSGGDAVARALVDGLSDDLTGLGEWFLDGDASPFLRRARVAAAEDALAACLALLVAQLSAPRGAAAAGGDGLAEERALLDVCAGAFGAPGSAATLEVSAEAARALDAAAQGARDASGDGAADAALARVRELGAQPGGAVAARALAQAAKLADGGKRSSGLGGMMKGAASPLHGARESRGESVTERLQRGDGGSLSATLMCDPVARLDDAGAEPARFTLAVVVVSARDVSPDATVAVELRSLDEDSAPVGAPPHSTPAARKGTRHLEPVWEWGCELGVADPWVCELCCVVSDKGERARRRAPPRAANRVRRRLIAARPFSRRARARARAEHFFGSAKPIGEVVVSLVALGNQAFTDQWFPVSIPEDHDREPALPPPAEADAARNSPVARRGALSPGRARRVAAPPVGPNT